MDGWTDGWKGGRVDGCRDKNNGNQESRLGNNFHENCFKKELTTDKQCV